MNKKKIRLITVCLIMLTLCVVMPGSGCDEDNEYDEYSDYLEGYVVGSFIGDEVNAEGQATGNKTERGYCILLGGDGEKSMDFYTFNFPENLFVFSEEILSSTYNINNCGPIFFPDSLKYVYKIKFKYQIIEELDKVKFVTGPCLTMVPPFSWEFYDEGYINEIIKN